MIKQIELKNYKSHKHYIADFNGNSIIEGNKGSGKTSLKDAFTWVMTGTMVDDPTPVDENGQIINHLTISARVLLEDGTSLMIESKQRWVKDELKANHSMTYFVNDTPMIKREYDDYLTERFGTLEQRRIMLDPTWFAHGDGLRIGGKTSKTATQRRREIVIDVAGIGELEDKITENEETAKQAKYAISQLKKQLDEANAGIESLYEAKVDTSYLDKGVIQESIQQLEQEKEQTYNALNNLNVDNTLQEALNKAKLDLSNARSKYSQEYSLRLEQAQKPLQEFNLKKRNLQDKLVSLEYENRQLASREQELLRSIDTLSKQREDALKEYAQIKESTYQPDSVTCQCCGQVLPPDRLREHEARFNKQRSDNLEHIIKLGNNIKEDLETQQKELSLLAKPHDLTQLRNELANMVAPNVDNIPTFEETQEYIQLTQAVEQAQFELNQGSDDSAKEIYRNAIDNINLKIKELQQQLNSFDTNDHLDMQIERKGEELRGIAENLDKQQEKLDAANEFVRKTLESLETTIESKFDGIRFKMFEYTLDGTQKDTCITYAKTDVGYIPWENLSGGQKRSATIKLANAFAKAWGVEMPLWIDDTQIYTEDEVNASMQLIRITEVPHKKLEVR